MIVLLSYCFLIFLSLLLSLFLFSFFYHDLTIWEQNPIWFDHPTFKKIIHVGTNYM